MADPDNTRSVSGRQPEPVTHPELEEAIKHVTAYYDCQIGMLDYSKLWRLVVAARQYVWLLQRTEDMHGALTDRGAVDISDILGMKEPYTVREFLDQRLSSPTLTSRILERVVGPIQLESEHPFSAARGLMDDLNAERARNTALARDVLGHLKAARLFVDDSIQNGHDRAVLGNLYGARDEIDAAISKAEGR